MAATTTTSDGAGPPPGTPRRPAGRPILAVALVAVPTLAVLGVQLASRPYFGNMDDSGLLLLAGAHDPLSYAQLYGGRPDYGFLNQFSMLLTWPAYRTGSAVGPEAFFALNAVLVVAILAIAGWSFASLLTRRPVLLVAVSTATALCWPYTLELFFFPSLQEKGVILAAAGFLLWLRYAPGWRSPVLRWLVLGVVLAAALTSKTHIVVFVPGLLLATFARSSPPGALSRRSATIAAAGLLAVSAFVVLLTLTGSYSRDTRGSVRLTAVATDRRLWLLGLLTVVVVCALVARHRRRGTTATEWVPAVLLATMCAVFAVWAVRNYYLSVAGPMLGMAAILLASWVTRQRALVAGAVALSIVACAVVAFRLPSVLVPLGSIRELLVSPVGARLDADGARIAVSCGEAPTHFDRYADWLGRPDVDFYAGSADNEPLLVWSDDRLCPWPVQPGWQVVWTDPGGWTLYATRAS